MKLYNVRFVREDGTLISNKSITLFSEDMDVLKNKISLTNIIILKKWINDGKFEGQYSVFKNTRQKKEDLLFFIYITAEEINDEEILAIASRITGNSDRYLATIQKDDDTIIYSKNICNEDNIGAMLHPEIVQLKQVGWVETTQGRVYMPGQVEALPIYKFDEYIIPKHEPEQINYCAPSQDIDKMYESLK